MSTYNIAVYENATALREIYKYLPEIDIATEVLLNLLGIFPLILVIFLFYKIKVFHFNLTILLIDLMASYLMRTIARIVICGFIAFSNSKDYEKNIICNYLDFVCGICQYVCGMNLWLIFMERLYATTKAKNYEHQFTPFIILILILSKWIIVGVFIFITAYSKITIFVPIAACAVLLTISGIGMAYLLNLNYKLYKKQTTVNRNLSYRYQVSENVRSFEMLIPMMTLLLLGCIVGMIAYALMMLLTDILLKAIFGAAFNLIVAAGAIVLPIVTMFSHRNLRRKILKVLKQRKKIKKIKSGRVTSTSDHQITTTTTTVVGAAATGVGVGGEVVEMKEIKKPPISYIVVPMTLTGKKLIMETPDEATNVYFKQISAMWN